MIRTIPVTPVRATGRTLAIGQHRIEGAGKATVLSRLDRWGDRLYPVCGSNPGYPVDAGRR